MIYFFIIYCSFKVGADGNTCLPYYLLLMERSKTFANAFEELSSASRINSWSFDAAVPKAVEKVVVQVQKDPKPTAVQIAAAAALYQSLRHVFALKFHHIRSYCDSSHPK